jgi:hypothetical protein
MSMGKITGFLARSAAGQRSTCLLVAIKADVTTVRRMSAIGGEQTSQWTCRQSGQFYRRTVSKVGIFADDIARELGILEVRDEPSVCP